MGPDGGWTQHYALGLVMEMCNASCVILRCVIPVVCLNYKEG